MASVQLDIRPHLHGAKLEANEPPPSITHPFLQENHWATGNAFDQKPDPGRQWYQERQSDQDTRDIQTSFPERWRIADGTIEFVGTFASEGRHLLNYSGHKLDAFATGRTKYWPARIINV